jgi:hypothetical protein
MLSSSVFKFLNQPFDFLKYLARRLPVDQFESLCLCSNGDLRECISKEVKSEWCVYS